MSHTIAAFGEALFDLLPSGAVLGGAPLNFAYRVSSLGNRGVIISRLGRDENGRKALDLIRSLGMETEYIQSDPDRPTGTVEITLDKNREPDYFIVPEAAYDYIESGPDLAALVAEAECLCFGTLIQRGPSSRETLKKLLNAFNGKYVLLDINLRKNCYTPDTIKDSVSKADILKVNEEEVFVAASAFGISASNITEIVSAIMDVTSLSLCIVTLGEAGALAFSRGKEPEYSPGYRIDLVDPCGSGDAFTAAFLSTLIEGGPLIYSLQRGNALGAIVATQKGATVPVTPDDIDRFLLAQKPRVVREEYRSYIHTATV